MRIRIGDLLCRFRNSPDTRPRELALGSIDSGASGLAVLEGRPGFPWSPEEMNGPDTLVGGESVDQKRGEQPGFKLPLAPPSGKNFFE